MNYLNKYLKYKKKYLNIQIGGNKYIITKETSKDNIDNFNCFINNHGIEIYKKYYFIILNISDKDYNCVINNSDPIQLFIYIIHNKCTVRDIINSGEDGLFELLNKSSFIKIDGFSSGDEITTNLDFERLDGKNKLQTIMDILEHLYIHFGHPSIILKDMAEFKCPSAGLPKVLSCLNIDEFPKYEYNAIIYRIFSTDKSIHELSIYGNFGYIPIPDKLSGMNIILKHIRDFKIDDYINLLRINYDILQKKFHEKLEMLICILEENSDDTIHNFYKKIPMTTMLNCNENFNYFNIITFMIGNKSTHDHNEFLTKLRLIHSYISKITKEL
jgi:hypothetical protein